MNWKTLSWPVVNPFLGIGLFFCCALSLVKGNEPMEVSLPTNVKEALIKNASALQVINLSWEKKYTTQLTQSELSKKIGEKGAIIVLSSITKIRKFAWQNGKYYQRFYKTGPDPIDILSGKKATTEEEQCFDGSLFQSGSPTIEEDKALGYKPDEVLIVYSHDLWKKKRKDQWLIHEDYFNKAGYEFYRTPLTIDQPIQSLILHQLNTGWRLASVREQRFEDINCLIVELTGTGASGSIRYTLDPHLGYAIRKIEELEINGKRKSATTNFDFMRLSGTDTWLPRRCVTSLEATPLYQVVIKATDISNKPLPDNQFRLNYDKPGSRVTTSEVPGASDTEEGVLYYRIPTNPAHLDRVLSEAAKKQSLNQRIPPSRYILIVLSIILVGALLTQWVIRRRRMKMANA